MQTSISTTKKKQCEKFYHSMLFIRRFEEKAAQFYGMGKISGFCHLYMGQEAVVVGMLSVATKDDKHITSYRAHGHILAVGSDPGRVMAELMGKATGCSKGKGGSMHLFDLEKNFYGGHGIVGAQVPIGTGLAFAEKYLEKKGITYVYYGDGAAHQGQVYESFNMAKLWNLPVIYIIENNEYGMGTSVSRATGMTELYKRGESFGIPGVRADGMDVFAMEKVAKEASDYVRKGNGPFLIEAKTYRYKGHSMSDPAKYRTRSEVQDIKDNKDPISNLKNFILKNKYLSEERLDEIDASIKNKMKEVVKFAEESPLPDPDELYKDI
ncbi:MAG: pyruvate dehydrogenase (acetyl-transferring) E1 component subunit alpha [Rickettsiales bacterium]|nr:pyruvate dehydrogenase (acetyl-transferring) E1 component subunit alpha [Rickettsiales bacterium]